MPTEWIPLVPNALATLITYPLWRGFYSSRDYREQRRHKTLAYTWALQDWKGWSGPIYQKHGSVCNGDVWEDDWPDRLYNEIPSGIVSAGPCIWIKIKGDAYNSHKWRCSYTCPIECIRCQATPRVWTQAGGPLVSTPDWDSCWDAPATRELYEMLLVYTIVEYHKVVMGELSVVIEVLEV